MDNKNVEDILTRFRWKLLERVYGCAHNTIIGFIATEWLSLSQENSVLDGAPAAQTGKGRKGQKNADLILGKGNAPSIVVEVETGVSKYPEKLESLLCYLHNSADFQGLQLGLLVMTNGYAPGKTQRKHNWESLKDKAREEQDVLAFISVEKNQFTPQDSVLSRLRCRNNYARWDIVNVDYWAHDAEGELEGNLWRK